MRIFKLSRKKSIRDKKKLKIIFVNFKKYWQSFIQLQIYFNKPWCLWVQRGHHLGNTMNDQDTQNLNTADSTTGLTESFSASTELHNVHRNVF
jgi:hypothetical protein